MQLEAGGAAADHLLERRGARGVALAGKAEIDGDGFRRLEHAAEMPRPGRAGGGGGAGGGAGAAADQRGDAGGERLVRELRADEVDMAVDAAGGQDFSFAGDDFGSRADDDIDAGLDVGVAGLADPADAPAGDRDVGLHDPPVIEDERVGDDGVHSTGRTRGLGLAHAVADDFSAAELHFLAGNGEVAFDLDEEIGVGEADAVADGGAEHVRIGGAGEMGHQSSAPITWPRKPKTARRPR